MSDTTKVVSRMKWVNTNSVTLEPITSIVYSLYFTVSYSSYFQTLLLELFNPLLLKQVKTGLSRWLLNLLSNQASGVNLAALAMFDSLLAGLGGRELIGQNSQSVTSTPTAKLYI